MASTLCCKVRSRKTQFFAAPGDGLKARRPDCRFPDARPVSGFGGRPFAIRSPPAFAPRSMKVSVITLGCDKNTVDSERYVAQLADHGATYTSDLDDADVVLVNTCGFIDAAKKESIDAMVEAGRLKDRGPCKAVVGVGCMVERHKDELSAALPEVDLFLGSSEMDRLIPELEERGFL